MKLANAARLRDHPYAAAAQSGSVPAQIQNHVGNDCQMCELLIRPHSSDQLLLATELRLPTPALAQGGLHGQERAGWRTAGVQKIWGQACLDSRNGDRAQLQCVVQQRHCGDFVVVRPKLQAQAVVCHLVQLRRHQQACTVVHQRPACRHGPSSEAFPSYRRYITLPCRDGSGLVRDTGFPKPRDLASQPQHAFILLRKVCSCISMGEKVLQSPPALGKLACVRILDALPIFLDPFCAS